MTSLGDNSLETAWAVAAGILIFAQGSLRVEFAADSMEEFSTIELDVSAPARAFTVRAEAANVYVSGLTFKADGRRLDYASEDGSAVNSDQVIEALGDSLGQSAVVAKADLKAEGRDLYFNLETATAYGNTRSRFALSTVLTVAAGLSSDLGYESQKAIRDLFDDDSATESATDESLEEKGMEP